MEDGRRIRYTCCMSLLYIFSLNSFSLTEHWNTNAPLYRVYDVPKILTALYNFYNVNNEQIPKITRRGAFRKPDSWFFK